MKQLLVSESMWNNWQERIYELVRREWPCRCKEDFTVSIDDEGWGRYHLFYLYLTYFPDKVTCFSPDEKKQAIALNRYLLHKLFKREYEFIHGEKSGLLELELELLDEAAQAGVMDAEMYARIEEIVEGNQEFGER